MRRAGQYSQRSAVFDLDQFPMTEIIDFTVLHRPFKSPQRPARDARKADLISLKTSNRKLA
jgi:hypothetical protein